jgi:hypothetical protein
MRIKEWGGASRIRLDGTVRPLVQFMGSRKVLNVVKRLKAPGLAAAGESIPHVQPASVLYYCVNVNERTAGSRPKKERT